MGAEGALGGSFRDPAGFLFRHDEGLYRQINWAYQKDYERLIDSGLYAALVAAGLLIPHQEVAIESDRPDDAYLVIQPERVPFVSYPYEWSFSQLKDAALTTLEVQKRALAYDLSLKDASAYNIQFRQGKPVLIDTLSFERYREGVPWTAYRQFCQHFLAPLALMGCKDIRLSRLLEIYIDGIPLDLASGLLPARTRLAPGLGVHIHLHARSQRRFAATALPDDRRAMSRLALLGLVDNLERAVRALTWQPQGTEWVRYEDETAYSADAQQQKAEAVSRFLDRIEPRVVWDLGANTGFFSRVAAGKGVLVVAADLDPACVEVNYLRCVSDGEANVLPLLLDLTNPSPALGWAGEERMSIAERGPADVVLALALLHHLAISNNVPLGRVARFLASLCRWLVIEFVPKEDPQVQRLLRSREDVFANYTRDAFTKEFGRLFDVHASAELDNSQRVLYLMEKRSALP